MFTVKKLALSTLLTGSVLFFPAIHAVASVPQHVVKQQAGGYSVQVGDTIVTAFTDGSVPQDLHALLRRTTAENTDALLAKNFRPIRWKRRLTRSISPSPATKFWWIPVPVSSLAPAKAGG